MVLSRVLVSSTEFGGDQHRALANRGRSPEFAYEDVRIAQPDTIKFPTAATVASRTAMVVGSLVRSAAVGIKQR